MKVFYAELSYPGFLVSDSSARRLDKDFSSKEEAVEWCRQNFPEDVYEMEIKFRTEIVIDGELLVGKFKTYVTVCRGKIRSAEDILAGTDPKEGILRDNVRINKIPQLLNVFGRHFEIPKDAVVIDA